MKWRYIPILSIGFVVLIGLGFVIRHDARQMLTDPISSKSHTFTEQELERVRAAAKKGGGWDGSCENASKWYAKDQKKISLINAAAYAGNVLAILCQAKMAVHDPDPDSMDSAYDGYIWAIFLNPELPDAIKQTRAMFETIIPYPRIHEESSIQLVRENQAKFIAAGTGLFWNGSTEMLREALKKLPSEAQTQHAIAQRKQKFAYWGTHCTTLEGLTETDNVKRYGIYRTLEHLARKGNVDAMLCAARFYNTQPSDNQNKESYYWYSLAFLYAPEIAADLETERKVRAKKMTPEETAYQQQKAEEAFELRLRQ